MILKSSILSIPKFTAHINLLSGVVDAKCIFESSLWENALNEVSISKFSFNEYVLIDFSWKLLETIKDLSGIILIWQGFLPWSKLAPVNFNE